MLIHRKPISLPSQDLRTMPSKVMHDVAQAQAQSRFAAAAELESSEQALTPAASITWGHPSTHHARLNPPLP